MTDARPTVLVGDAEGLLEGLGVLAGEYDEDLLLGVVWDLGILEDPDGARTNDFGVNGGTLQKKATFKNWYLGF